MPTWEEVAQEVEDKPPVADREAQLESEIATTTGTPLWEDRAKVQELKGLRRERVIGHLINNGSIENAVLGLDPDNITAGEVSAQKRTRAIIDLSPDPAELSARLAASWVIADSLKIAPSLVVQNWDIYSKKFYGTTNAKTVLGKLLENEKEVFGTNRRLGGKTMLKAADDAIGNIMLTGLAIEAGTALAIGDLGNAVTPGGAAWAEDLSRWGRELQRGVDLAYQARPDLGIQIRGDGFLEKTAFVATNPAAIVQATVETLPVLAFAWGGGAVLGGAVKALGASQKAVSIAAWAGRVEGIAAPLFAQQYSRLRMDGSAPSTAFYQSILTSHIEALIEEWTLGQKLKLFKGTAIPVRKEMARKIAGGILEGLKIYARGTAEEATQTFNANFWNMVFTNPDQDLLEGVASSAAIGGPVEFVLSGAFAGAGKIARQVNLSKTASGIAQRTNVTRSQAKQILKEVEAELKTKLADNSLSVEARNKLYNDEVTARVGADMKANYYEEIQKTPEISAEEKLNRIESIRSVISKSGLSVRDMIDLNKILDAKKAEVEAGEEAPQATPAGPESETSADIIDRGQPVGTEPSVDGDSFAVKDWATNETLQTTETETEANTISDDYNSGKLIVPSEVEAVITEEQVAQESPEQTKARTEHSKAVKGLSKTIATINRKNGAVAQKGGIRAEFQAKIKALTDTFTTKANPEKRRQAAESLQAHLKDVKDSLGEGFRAGFVIEQIPKSLLESIGEISARPVSEMSADQVEELDTALRRVVHINDTKNRIIRERISRDKTAMLAEAVEEVEPVIDISVDPSELAAAEQDDSPGGVLRGFFKFMLGRSNHDIETVTTTLSGGQFGRAYQIFVDDVAAGRERADDYQSRAQGIIKKAFADNDISLSDLQGMSRSFLRFFKGKKGRQIRALVEKAAPKIRETFPKFKTGTPLHTIEINGKKQKLTMDELMAIVMHSRTPVNGKALVKDGVAFNIPAGKMSVSEVEAVISIVESNPKALAILEAAAEVHKLGKVEINDTSRALDGIDAAKEENYTHLERFRSGGVSGPLIYSVGEKIESQGRLKPKKGGRAPVRIRGIFDMISADINAISEYVGMAEPLRNMRTLVNYEPWRAALEAKGYRQHLATLDTLATRLQSPEVGGGVLDGLIAGILRGTVRSVLVEPRIILGQFMSLNHVFQEMSRKYMSKAKLKTSKKTKQRLKDHWASYKTRLEGGISSATLQQISGGDSILRAFTDKVDLVNTGMMALHAVDSEVVTNIGVMVQAEMADKNLDGPSALYWARQAVQPSSLEFESPEYWDAFVRRAGFIVRRTQPMFTPESKSLLTSEKSPSKRMWFLFRSYVDQNLRSASRTIIEYRNHRITFETAALRLGNIWATLAMYAALRALVSKFIYGEDKDAKDLLIDVTLAPLKLAPMLGYPAAKIIQAAIEETPDPRISPLPESIIQDTIVSIKMAAKGLRQLQSGERFKRGPNRGRGKGLITLQRSFLDMARIGGQALGVPTRTLLKVAERFEDGRKKAKKRGR